MISSPMSQLTIAASSSMLASEAGEQSPGYELNGIDGKSYCLKPVCASLLSDIFETGNASPSLNAIPIRLQNSIPA